MLVPIIISFCLEQGKDGGSNNVRETICDPQALSMYLLLWRCLVFYGDLNSD